MRLSRFVVWPTLLVAAACATEAPTPSKPDAAPQATSLMPELSSAPTVRSIDDAFAEIDRASPGFGGLFIDSTDRLTVWLKDTATAAAAEVSMIRIMGYKPGRAERGVRFLRAKYSFGELARWMSTLNRQIDMRSVVMADIDERNNQLFLGVRSAADSSSIAEEFVAPCSVRSVESRRISAL